MRDAFMDIDQNNVLAEGVPRTRITNPNNTNREGVSTTLDEVNAFNYASDTANPVTVADDQDGEWLTDDLVSLDVYSRWESVWMVGAGAAWLGTALPVGNEMLEVDLGITTGSGLASGISTGVINARQLRSATHLITSVILPPGPSTITLTYRVRWGNAAHFDVDYDTRNLFAFALYR